MDEWFDENSVVQQINSLDMKPGSLDGQYLDNELVEWYKSRFEMFIDDGVPQCISIYMEHVQQDESVNSYTRLKILQIGLHMIVSKK